MRRTCSTHSGGVPNKPARAFPERDDDGTGQRGHVDEMRGAELLRVPETVAQNQPPLGVGVDDFDGLPRRALQDVARLDRAAARHVLRRRHDADDADRRLEQRDRAHRARDGGAARHVVLHPLHAVGRLD